MTDQTEGVLPPPGWYADPQDPARERWWSGASWTEFDHRAAKPGMFGEAYARAFWPGANALARRALLLLRIGFVLLLVVLAASYWASAAGATLTGTVVGGFVSMLLCCVGFGVAGMVFGVRAIRASGALGGGGVAVQSTVASAVLVLWALTVLAFALVV
ncbi:DUF2510 domain-containing protein [Herbiconiux sp. VKM Ac-2851]|uniref:DUF2510 domain-containing protein n=1 Tax=Herbiconiux sp. VKM Ac-2851 TaxID=2739025 RepID=UPI001C2035AE|nr:DUF2510 domain-containing protein [Herbiconiux sp. VKM Ac-2851]